MKLGGRTAIVTGGGSGIGKATSLLFGEEGANVVVADKDEGSARDVARVISDSGGSAIAVHADVSIASDVKQMVAKTLEAFGPVHVLYNNAGITIYKPLLETSDEDWDNIMNINLKSAFLCTRSVIPTMKSGGSIVNLSSAFAVVGIQDHCAYAAAKGGLVAMTRALGIELAPLGIRVNCICPGPVETPLLGSVMSQDEIKRTRAKQYRSILTGKMGRPIGQPEDIAKMALYLASDDSCYVTGANFMIDGGITSYHPRAIL